MNDAFHLGHPSPGFGKWQVFTFHIHGFQKLAATKGKPADLPPFTCFDHEWKLLVYPGGVEDAADKHASLYLQHITKGRIQINWSCFVRDMSEGGSTTSEIRSCDLFDQETKAGRCNLMRVARHGPDSLTFELHMKSRETGSNFCFVPKNPFSENMLKLFMDHDTSDVSFDVNGETLCGHRAVLKLCAPFLASLCERGGKTKAVPISGISTKIFRRLLQYVYGGKVPVTELQEHAQEFIEGADKYGVTNLKLEAERIYVANLELTVENVVDALLYADSKNLALLKEAAMNFIFKNAEDVLSAASFTSMPADQNIMSELLSVVAMTNKCRYSKVKPPTYKSMSVADLRWELATKKLDVDGSREILVARLEEQCEEGITNDKKRKAGEI